MNENLERSIKDKIKEIAKSENRTFNDVWKTLVLERFLARLSQSTKIDNLIFKGGMLLSKYIPLARETVDLDFLALNLPASVETIRDSVSSILDLKLEDGFSFVGLEVTLLPQVHMNYPGYAVKAIGLLGGTRNPISIDIGVGDVVKSSRKNIKFLSLKSKPLYEPSVYLQVYPVEYIFAEKLETIIFRGSINSRMKDFSDIWLLLNDEKLDIKKTKEAILETFANRKTELQLVTPLFHEDEQKLESNWQAFLRGLQPLVISKLPSDPQKIIKTIDKWLIENGFTT